MNFYKSGNDEALEKLGINPRMLGTLKRLGVGGAGGAAIGGLAGGEEGAMAGGLMGAAGLAGAGRLMRRGMQKDVGQAIRALPKGERGAMGRALKPQVAEQQAALLPRKLGLPTPGAQGQAQALEGIGMDPTKTIEELSGGMPSLEETMARGL